MPTYRVESTKQMYPSSKDWSLTLTTTSREEARAAVSHFDDRPYPHKTRWQRLFEDDVIVVIRQPVKPRIVCAGRDSSGVQRWWIEKVDKSGFGGSSSTAGTLKEVYAQIMRGHHWHIERHRLGQA